MIVRERSTVYLFVEILILGQFHLESSLDIVHDAAKVLFFLS